MNIRLIAVAALAVAFTGAFAQGPKASAEEMIAAINAVKMPTVDRSKVEDKDYVAQYMKERNEAMAKRATLILDFYKAHPTHEQTPALMQQRWQAIVMTPADVDKVIIELDEIIQGAPSEKLVEVATYTRANYGVMQAGRDGTKALAAADMFVKKYPTDERGANLLASAAEAQPNKEGKLAVYERIVKDYPNARGAKYTPGKIKQLKGLGQPFELSFTDAISGKKTTMADFKGKVVVIDFWATWCGPCIADLPKVQKMYADLKDQGVEIISISLDQPEDKGGLKSLRDFVAKNPMPWAHYYQGNFWDSEFSTSWGINSIPALFLVDQNGVLVDVQARANLEDRVKALLKNNK